MKYRLQEETRGYMTLDAVRHIFPPGMHCRLWLVGGSVRDRLRGEPVQDADLIASCLPEELAEDGFHPVAGKSTGPIWFRSHPQLGLTAEQLERVPAQQRGGLIAEKQLEIYRDTLGKGKIR